jgi:uncharacterized protein
MANTFCHIELNTDNAGRAKEYYGQLFTWAMEEVPMPGHPPYTMLKTGAEPGGGIQVKPMPEAPNMWLVYVAVDDIDATVKKSEKLGGKTIVPKMPIPGMGTLAILEDPTGAHFAIWKGDKP